MKTERVNFNKAVLMAFVAISAFFPVSAWSYNIPASPPGESLNVSEIMVNLPPEIDITRIKERFDLRLVLPGIGHGTVAGEVSVADDGSSAGFRSSASLIPGMSYEVRLPDAEQRQVLWEQFVAPKSAASLSLNGMGGTVTYPAGPFSAFFDGNLVGADYWSEEPKILSASLGFCDTIGLDASDLTKTLVRRAGGAWLSDIDCGDNAGSYTRAALQQTIARVWVHQTPYGVLKDGAIGLDGLPVVFSWPVDTSTIDLTDFHITLNTGEVVMPLAAGPVPCFENNERNVVVLFGEFGNEEKSRDDEGELNPHARFATKCEIVEDETPLLLVGPNNQVVSAVGLTWENEAGKSPYDDNNGPKLVGAKLNHVGEEPIGEGVSNLVSNFISPPNDEFVLYGGGDFRLRVLTTGGFSPDGVRGVNPTDYEKFFRIHAKGEGRTTVLIEEADVPYQVRGGTLTVIGLSDLGGAEGGNIIYGDCYAEDTDNYIDIIIEGDEEAARNITHVEIPTSLEGGYSSFYNPGGPGTTPFPNEEYTAPGPYDLEPVIIALDDPMRVTYSPGTGN